MNTKLAQLIKLGRKAKRLSQSQLSEGICTQAVVSKIEKGDITPSVDIFFKLIKKLTIPLSTIAETFEMDLNDNSELLDKIERLIYINDLETLDIILSNYKEENLTAIEKNYFLIYRLMIEYKLKNRVDNVIQELSEIINNSSDVDLYLRAQLLLGNIYSSQGDTQMALNIFKEIE